MFYKFNIRYILHYLVFVVYIINIEYKWLLAKLKEKLTNFIRLLTTKLIVIGST